MKIALFLALTAAAGIATAQDAYKCSIGGATVHQDRPCPGARRSADMPAAPAKPATAPSVGATPAGDTRAAGDLDRSKAYLAAREKERRIEGLREQIVRMQESIAASQFARDDEISGLQARAARANNNLAGASLEQAMATEMQAVNARYATDISVKQDRLKQLRDELAQAERP
jgi:hypothetical protein